MGLRNSFVWRRAGSARLLLASVLLSTLIAASVTAALAGFAASSLPQAVSAELAQAPRATIVISGALDAAQARADSGVVRAEVRRAFGSVPAAFRQALWSDPIALPAPRGAKTVSLVQAAAADQIETHAVLTAGAWPTAPRAPGAPVPAAAPASVATALHLAPGTLLSLRDRLTGARVRIRLTGFYRPSNPASPYWGLDLIAASGVSVQPGFITYGPFVVAAGAFGRGHLAIGAATWLATPVISRISAAELRPLAGRLTAMQAYLTRSPDLGGLQVSTGLPAALTGVATKLIVARSLLTVGALELLLLAAAALAMTARTLASQREEESVVLSARGAGRWQLVRLALVEALLVTVVAAVAGALAGSRLAAVLARSGSLRSAGLRLHGVPAAVWWTAAAVLVLCVAIMIWPGLRPGPGVGRLRKGRQAVLSSIARSGGDGALVLLALLAGWQLRRYAAVSQTAGGFGIDPVLAVAPAVALAAAAVIPLRLLPVVARAADRLAARTRRLGTAMASWEISRRAVRQNASMLLVVLAVGTGTLALAQHQSWRRSVLDQSAFAAGADVRVETPVPVPMGLAATIAHARGVTAAMAVSTAFAVSSGSQVLAVDAARAAATVLLRSDESTLPAAALWRRIIPAGSGQSVTLPGRPARLEIIASLDLGTRSDLGPATASVTIADATGAVYTMAAGQLPADGRSHGLVVELSRTGQAIYPLKLLALSLSYTLPPVPSGRQAVVAAAGRTAVFAVHGLATSAALAGAFPSPFAQGRALAQWMPAVSADGLEIEFAAGAPPALLPYQSGPARDRTLRFNPGYGHTGQSEFTPQPPFGPVPGVLSLTAPAASVIPGIATQAFLDSEHLSVGAVLPVSAGAAALAVKIVAAVRTFPTVTSPAGGLIVDLGSAQEIVAAQSATPVPVGQWWLATTAGTPAGLPAGAVTTSRAQLSSMLQGDPLSAIPQRAVQSVAVAAALIAILGFSVSIAGRARERRSQSALLAALGVGAATQARLLCLEALAVSLPAAATGLALGAVLARLLVPAVTLTAAAAAPVPPVLVQIPLATSVGLALAIAAVPVLVAAATAAYRPDPAAQLRAVEVT